ncbi:MAG: protein-L-isoaspartate O-methyltransferase [Steroidobacteraceae bacterium]|jgi:protein-L-isoaspartate(D-aspartate) O-methyltransferase
MTTVALEQMVMQQVRAWDVLEDRVLDTLRKVPRERFVPRDFRAVAYADAPIPLPHGQHMLTPQLIGRILQAIDATPTESVLEVGTGSGYLTACLAISTRQVRSIEIHEDLAASARARLAAEGIANADVRTADVFELSFESHYDIIVLTGSLPGYDERFQRALAVGGRLFAVVGEGPAMSARLVHRTSPTNWMSRDLFETWVAPLLHAARPPRFVF